MRLFRYLRADDCEASNAVSSRRVNRSSPPNTNGRNNGSSDTGAVDQQEFIMKRRAARREWYNDYLRPYTTTISKSNISLYRHRCDDTVASNCSHSSSRDESEEEDSKNILAKGADNCPHQTTKTPELCIIIPPKLSDLSSTTDEAAECPICFRNYCLGDLVVRASEDGCPHVYHKDCILPWLERGKKRCPMCRQWFVCPKSIEEQKKEQLANISHHKQ